MTPISLLRSTGAAHFVRTLVSPPAGACTLMGIEKTRLTKNDLISQIVYASTGAAHFVRTLVLAPVPSWVLERLD